MLKIVQLLTVMFVSQLLVSPLLVSPLTVFGSFAQAGQLALPSGDLVAPQINHTPIDKSIKAGSRQIIKASITDNVGVKTVTLYYRTIGLKNYSNIKMDKVEGTDDYAATLGFEDTVVPGIEYYIQAVDLAGNALLHGYSFSPLTIGIIPSEPGIGVAQTEVDSNSFEQDPIDEPVSKQNKTNTWLWVGLGILAAGAVAAVAVNNDGGGSAPSGTPGTETGRVSFSAPIPIN